MIQNQIYLNNLKPYLIIGICRYTVGAICTITQADGIIPQTPDIPTFGFSFLCNNANGCPPGTPTDDNLLVGLLDGKYPS